MKASVNWRKQSVWQPTGQTNVLQAIANQRKQSIRIHQPVIWTDVFQASVNQRERWIIFPVIQTDVL